MYDKNVEFCVTIKIGDLFMQKVLNIGVDVGSTTVKVVVLDKKLNILYSEYRRHFSDTKATIKALFNEVLDKFPNYNFTINMTGSGAIALAKYLDVPFVQEVIACKNAIRKYTPSVDVAIELGGEDAKIIYFDQTIEQRMNGSCAGGTGAGQDEKMLLYLLCKLLLIKPFRDLLVVNL